jgi:hypothetical protein
MKVNVEELDKLVRNNGEGAREVVSLISRSPQNNHYYGMRIPFMNIVYIPADLEGYEVLEVKGFEDVELYIKN